MAGIKAYIQDAAFELLNKVSWPTWKELQTSAIIVLVTSVIISLMVWVMDFVFGIWPAGEEGFWKGMLGFFYEMFNPSSK
ncbi:MAG: preprotein translocase subunit SecE [Flavobacteriales bacterium]|nr:preprotein translocase subunit SecE [Flavobacteriales bacterium]